ncbi:uncharacterized protein LOC111281725 [Durio zibethinus]|uniref:Uncharacterized protein LOC111281725 n=1 Tax=Durio zibethinus TaxID=66656 RepID=A0A6P5XBB1_DURZI|nr:uncharacterized protein LOC111281725 [Durio zibethinus]
MPWIIGGDFNEIAAYSDKSNFFNMDVRRCRFQEVIQSCELIDLVGPKYTWCKSPRGLSTVWERIDRVLCTASRKDLFPVVVVLHLSRVKHGHCPILLNTEGIWNHNSDDFPVKLDNLATTLVEWNKSTFGNIFNSKRRILAGIRGAQKTLCQSSNPFL